MPTALALGSLLGNFAIFWNIQHIEKKDLYSLVFQSIENEV